MNRIRNFLYRSPRFTTNLRMDFIQGDAVFLGICTDVSASGLRGSFSEYVTPGIEGLVTLYDVDKRFQMRAKVYSIRESQVRIRFNLDSDKDREAVNDLMRLFSVRARR